MLETAERHRGHNCNETVQQEGITNRNGQGEGVTNRTAWWEGVTNNRTAGGCHKQNTSKQCYMPKSERVLLSKQWEGVTNKV